MADDKNNKNLKDTEKLLENIRDLTKSIRSEEEDWYRMKKEVNSGLEGYLKNVQEIIDLSKDVKTIDKSINDLKAKLVGLEGEALEKAEKRLLFLEREKAAIGQQIDLRKELNKEAKKGTMLAAEGLAAMGKGLAKVVGTVKDLPGFFGQFKEFFEMDKAIRTTVTQMGVLGKQGDIVRQNIKAAAVNTVSFGAGIKEIAEIQAQYTEDLGRNVMLSQQSLEAVAQMGKSTGLGLEGATEMAVQFDKMGVSAQKTGEFVQQTLDESKSMGVNATKVMKNLNQNFKMLNKYRFKDGIKGLIKMAETATKLGVDMEFAGGMAEKLFNIEGAVEMSAQLQVMGGAWAKMADPFKLMYQARNDIQGLTEEIASAASESMSFAADGSIQTNAMEMQRLRIVAEQTGLEYEKLVELGKTQFKLGKIKMQSGGLTPDMQEFLANTAEFKDGKAVVELKAGSKLVQFLTQQDINELKNMQAEKKSMEERAYQAQSFDEKISNLINMVKITMMPIIEGITEVLDPIVKDLMGEKSEFKKTLIQLGKDFAEFAVSVAKGIKWFIESVDKYFGPKGLLGIYLASVLLDKASWIANGILLAKGFTMGSGGGMFGGKGGMGRGFGAPTPAGGYTRNGMPINTQPRMGMGGKLMGKNIFGGKLAMGTMGSVAAGAGLGIAGYGTDKLRDSIYGEGSEEGKGLGVASAALKGAGMGAMLGPWGALAGLLIGGGIGAYDEYFNKPQNDAKFAGFGSTHSNGRAIVQGGKITPIDNKDDVLAMKRGGVVDKMMMGKPANKVDGVTKIEFGELNITGEIKINLPGSSTIGLELTKNQEFKTSITRIVQSQIEKQINGGKNRG